MIPPVFMERRARDHYGRQRVYRFPNDYGASLIDPCEGTLGDYEVAVLRFRGDTYRITYDTPLTSDVRRFRTEEEAFTFIAMVGVLP